MNSVERWLPIPGYEGLYEVSDLGRVKSLARTARVGGGGFRRVRERILTQWEYNSRDKYLGVILHSDGIGKNFYVHMLVLIAFVGPCPHGQEARHFPDRSKTNNKLRNLSWGTPAQNGNDRIIHGTWVHGETCASHKLTAEQVRFIRASKRSCVDLADHFGVHNGTISRIRTGKQWLSVK